ncbi:MULTISPECIES: M48 family metalloprotease [Ectothiorhodospira]|uniref:Putative Zn-dependent protease, contains TPR repeats n=1 Tax=Ectothiorhodospira marina TaxID=1396821 RepID=A0A1H7MHU3_9GAMM|nr:MULTISPECIES: M48 family metalloprotease [Ectothiorhodospira]MCG5514654.1 M48 family metalloprotease [Ectothiorhodospira sp. 9100]MCG5517972.1 M48 family metalloprotease [Ectothiorhodospira sp. 9905]SEL10752.1 Putative Zn-dependent protease, contains TPR repeats [Ectothiorhodospira marina]
MDAHPGNRILQRRMTRRDFLWLMSAASAGAVVVPQLQGCATDPVTGQQRLMLMSEQEEINIDKQHAPHQFSNDYGLLRDARVNRYVSEVGTSVAEVSHRPHMPYSHNVVNANYINAYTFPGGTMACTRGIMVEMDDEAQLAALLGHETGHVNARHTARRQTKGILAALALGGIGIAAAQSEQLSGYSNLIYAVSAVGATALLAHYSRENEREADDLGLQYMAEAGQNPEGMVELMDMLRGMSDRQPNALETMFSTHPMSQERFDTAQREAQSRYGDSLGRNVRRERYMDNTHDLRRIKPAIKEMQAGEERMAQEQPRQAEEHFAKALRQVPDDYPGLVLMSKAKSAQGQHREAQRYLEQARASYPGEGQAVHLSGINQLAMNRPDAALDHFQRYERMLPGNPNTVFLQGVALEGMQNRQAAAQQYRRYVQQVGTQTQQGQYAVQRLQAWQ